MNDDNKPLTKKDLIDALEELDGIRLDIHNTEIRILKSIQASSRPTELRLQCLEHFAATTNKRLADLEKAHWLAVLRPGVTQLDKKLDRRQ